MSFEMYCTKNATLLFMYLSSRSCSLRVTLAVMVEGIVICDSEFMNYVSPGMLKQFGIKFDESLKCL